MLIYSKANTFLYMKYIYVFFSIFFSFSVAAQNLTHPKNFSGNDTEKKEVINFIEDNVYKTYCQGILADSMCSESILRMMEEEELNSFKQLTKVNNVHILDTVWKTYCEGILKDSMCSYTVILMMYEEEVKASSSELSW